MLPDPRRFLEKLAQREQTSWARRARYLNEGHCTVTTHYSVYAVFEGALTRTHARTEHERAELADPDSRWLLVGFLVTEGHGDARRFQLVDRGRRGDKAVFWKANGPRSLEAPRFIITSRLAEDPRRVLVRPRTQPPAAAGAAVQIPKMPRVPAELLRALTPTTGVEVRPLPKTTPPPRIPTVPPPPRVTPLPSAGIGRLPLPSLRTFA